MTAAERLKKVRDLLGKNQKEMAELLGVNYRTYQNYETALNSPSWDACEAIVRLGFNANWLLTGEGEMKRGGITYPYGDELKTADLTNDINERYVKIPRYEVAASAGGGAPVHSEQIVDYLTFKAGWLKMSLGLPPAQAAVISVIGDSMEPYLANGDLILVDTSVDRIENDSIYVIQSGDSLLVKRIQKKLDGTVIVKSDNAMYEPEIFRGESTELLRVIGRVVRRLVK